MTIKDNNKDHLTLVAEFMKAMGQDVSIGWGNTEQLALGLKLIAEEAEEVKEAGYRVQYAEDAHKTFFPLVQEVAKYREDFVKELADLLYVINWTCAALGIDSNEAYRAVHASNMSKLGLDGKPIKREDGKVLKGPNYHHPDLSNVVKKTPISL